MASQWGVAPKTNEAQDLPISLLANSIICLSCLSSSRWLPSTLLFLSAAQNLSIKHDLAAQTTVTFKKIRLGSNSVPHLEEAWLMRPETKQIQVTFDGNVNVAVV